MVRATMFSPEKQYIRPDVTTKDIASANCFNRKRQQGRLDKTCPNSGWPLNDAVYNIRNQQ